MRGLASAVALVLVVTAARAHAGEELAEARADYDAAAAAYDRGEYAVAATRFARADERAPNPRALRLAMAATLQTDDGALAMNLVDRSETRGADPAITELARKLETRFRATVGHVRAVCPAAAPCRPSIDGTPSDPARGLWVSPGRHVVRFEGPTAPLTRDVLVKAGERVDVPMPAPEVAPAAAPPPPAEKSAALSPAYFWTGAAVTGAAVVVASVLTVVVASKHDDFVAQPSAASADAGSAAQTRARVAWGAAGAFAVTTVVLGFVSGTF